MSQSMLAIKTKLGSSSNSLRDYSAARGLTAPDSMAEFNTWLGEPVDPPAPTYYSSAAVRSTVSAQDACDSLGPIITVYSTCQTLIVNCKLYTYFDAEPGILRTVLSGWYSIGDNWYYVGGNLGNIDSTGVCGCECITIYNEGSSTGNYTITNCNGTEQSPNLLAGASRNHCIQAGSSIIINSGLLTEVYCGTPCNANGDCTTC
jgi:hypothetical protein